MNLIIDPTDVKGKVTLKLDNVPWNQALHIIPLRIYNLDRLIDGNVLRVASKSKLDEEKGATCSRWRSRRSLSSRPKTCIP